MLILFASDDTVQGFDYWQDSSLPVPSGISSYVLSEQETLNLPISGRKPAILPLLGGTLSFSPQIIGFLTKPNFFL